MNVRIEQGRNERRLAIARFTRQSVGADSPEIEVVCDLYWPEDFTLDGDPFVLWPLSVTFVDTRQPAELSPAERSSVMEAIVRRASTATPDW